MPGHKHDHSKPRKADFWTYMNLLSDITSFGTSTIGFAQILDLFRTSLGSTNDDDMIFNDISIESWIISVCCMTYFVAGSSYCHYILSKNNQKTESHTPALGERETLVNGVTSDYGTTEEVPATELPLSTDAVPDIEQGLSSAASKSQAPLTLKQKIAVAGHVLSDTLDGASPIILVADFFKLNLPAWGKFLLFGGAVGYGAVGAVAEGRISVNSLKEHNQEQLEAQLSTNSYKPK